MLSVNYWVRESPGLLWSFGRQRSQILKLRRFLLPPLPVWAGYHYILAILKRHCRPLCSHRFCIADHLFLRFYFAKCYSILLFCQIHISSSFTPLNGKVLFYYAHRYYIPQGNILYFATFSLVLPALPTYKIL